MIRLITLAFLIVISLPSDASCSAGADDTVNRIVWIADEYLNYENDYSTFNTIPIGTELMTTRLKASQTNDPNKFLLTCDSNGAFNASGSGHPYDLWPNWFGSDLVYKINDYLALKVKMEFKTYHKGSGRISLTSCSTPPAGNQCASSVAAIHPVALVTTLIKTNHTPGAFTITIPNQNSFRISVVRPGELRTSSSRRWPGGTIKIYSPIETPRLSFSTENVILSGTTTDRNPKTREINFFSIFNPNTVDIDSSRYSISFKADNTLSATIGRLGDAFYTIKHNSANVDVPLDGTEFPPELVPSIPANGEENIPLLITTNFFGTQPGIKRSTIVVTLTVK